MSLRVWLPLTGDLHNQGLEDVSLTASANSSVSQEGKIGSCYQFGTSTSSYLKFNDVNFIKNFTECSVSLWVKILTWQSSYNTYFQFGFSGVNWAHYIFGLLRNSTGSTLCFTISNGSSATNANCLTPSLELNKWYHITLTYKNGHCKIYMNGQMTKDYSTSIVPDFSKVTFGTIGAGGPSGGSYQTNCLINDFRVYDHCLSQKEVKENSKGLIVHYPLTGIELENDTTIYDSSGYRHNATVVGTTTIDNTSPRYSSAIHMNNTSSANRIDADPLIIPTEAITVSFWMYTTKTNSYVMYIDQNLSFCVNAAGDAFWLSRTNSKGFSTAKLTTGVWHHIVLIRQDTTYKAYIDTEEIPRNMGNNVWTHSNGRLYLLNRNYNNSYAANASIVDFRMYVTALSEEDILELYQTSQSVDNKGNLYSYEYYEED